MCNSLRNVGTTFGNELLNRALATLEIPPQSARDWSPFLYHCFVSSERGAAAIRNEGKWPTDWVALHRSFATYACGERCGLGKVTSVGASGDLR
jgi:hypothetical protein